MNGKLLLFFEKGQWGKVNEPEQNEANGHTFPKKGEGKVGGRKKIKKRGVYSNFKIVAGFNDVALLACIEVISITIRKATIPETINTSH